MSINSTYVLLTIRVMLVMKSCLTFRAGTAFAWNELTVSDCNKAFPNPSLVL